MIEIIVASFIGSFMYDNIEFISTTKQQRKEGMEWHFVGPTEANPEVPNITVKNPVNGKDTIIWVLE